MADDPWAEFRTAPAADPWAEFRAQQPQAQQTAAYEGQQYRVGEQPRSVLDVLTGANGPRLQTWPERLVRGAVDMFKSGATLPGDVVSGKTPMYLPTVSDDPSSPDFVGNAGANGQVLNPEVIKRSVDFASAYGPINPMVRSGDRAIPGMAMSTERRVVPSAEDLKNVGGQQIEKSRNMGVEIQPRAVSDLGATIEQRLQEKGFNDTVAPETFGILANLRNPPEGAVATFGNLQNLRETLGRAAGSADARERGAAYRAIRELDDWLGAPLSEGSLAGTTTPEGATAAANLYKQGRGNYAAAARSGEFTGETNYAELSAKAANSGLNIDNRIRQRSLSILSDDAATRGWSPQELAQLEAIVTGGPARNAARYTGNFLGGGGGIGQSGLTMAGAALGAVGGGAAGSPGIGAAVGAGIPAVVGASARNLANALARREAGLLDETLRSRSPLYLQQPLNPAYPAKQDALIRALLSTQVTPQQ